ncbi:MAG TPA: ABC transporter ATP-binding protein [Alphaproteobacteria bacterium]|jgi:branched-chain amino acid transport system ATP-binding protein|nr:ABC transporter ATP-binding protein [Alphaproteobacteria bacterium]
MAEAAMLEVEALHAGYGAVEVLRSVALEVAPGEIVALLGSNGAGKSTLNNVICGLCRPSQGAVRFEGRNITGEAPEAIVALGVVQVPEGRHVFPTLTVRENLELGSYRRARAHRAANIERICGIFPRLRERLDQRAGTLSGGEQQMLAIGRALMAEPRLLILDEPSLGLSPRLVEEMFALIARLHEEGCAILLVEQNVVQSLAIADRGYVLENGTVALSGRAAELLDNAELKRSYLGI